MIVTTTLFFNLLKTIENKGATIKLNQDEINFIKKNPGLINKIQEEINKIITDNEINYHDIPKMICIMSDIYKTHFISEEIQNIRLINIIEFTIDSILELQVDPLPEVETQIIKSVVDSSLELLNTPVFNNFIVKEEKCCFRLFCHTDAS